ncbi:hypothetical protein HMPREF1544_04905 [Mucor circinelloides 1006PhL]|uniref:Glycoside hydrolase family 125 protein n=1 Tax=Mucor circinelloides f. circinelloides (strain 1006PhL) TaxID=1220926 RepID=S2JDG8_MUCC1|nr:hypothetical protein HMPREF1544_04905 [Mucor circinelloides 1006PhL]
MPAFNERTFKKTIPISLLVFFIVLMNLVMIFHYLLPNNDPPLEPPVQHNRSKLPPYEPPYYGLKLVRPKEKKFTSPVIEDFLDSLASTMKDKDLYTLLQNCLPNTLDTTVEWVGSDKKDPRAFLITGDIPAMWIRDSTNQITPYLRFVNQDQQLKDLVFGVIQVQASYLHYDPYANAFLRPWYAPKKEGQKRGSTSDRVVPPYDPDVVWESKYELDSIGHFFQLTNDYIEATGDVERVVTSQDWLKAIPRIFQVLRDQMENTWPSTQVKLFKPNASLQDPEPVSLKDGYRFRRYTDRPTETLGEYGIGGITRKCGLIRSAFRPSDDSTTFPYLIPSNAQLSVQLIKLSEHIELYLQSARAQRESEVFHVQYNIGIKAKELGATVRRAIYEHAVVSHPVFGQVFAFEVDCFGSQLMMDDANTPSLLSLPVLGFIDKNDTIYQNTRDFVLSEWNPWFFQGSFASGIGGPHTGQDMVWPMSLLMQIQTSSSEKEIRYLIDVLKRMAKKTGSLICESFNVNNPSRFTRPWFSWANGLAGTTILKVIQEFPHLA